MTKSKYMPSIAIYMPVGVYEKLKTETALRAALGDIDIESHMHDQLTVAFIQAIEEGGTSPIFLKGD